MPIFHRSFSTARIRIIRLAFKLPGVISIAGTSIIRVALEQTQTVDLSDVLAHGPAGDRQTPQERRLEERLPLSQPLHTLTRARVISLSLRRLHVLTEVSVQPTVLAGPVRHACRNFNVFVALYVDQSRGL